MGPNRNGDDFSKLVLDLGEAARKPLLITGSEEVEREAVRLGIDVMRSLHVDKDKAYLVDGLQAFGRFPVRTELSVLPADPKPDQPIGWAMYETQGVSVMNPNARIRLDGGMILMEWPIPDLDPVDHPVSRSQTEAPKVPLERLRSHGTPAFTALEADRAFLAPGLIA